MSKVSFIDPVASLSGALNRNENIRFRTRNGKTHAYCVTKPYNGPASEAQTYTRKNFGACVRETSVILKNDTLRAEWQARYDEYLEQVTRHPARCPHPCSTLRGFIISTLREK